MTATRPSDAPYGPHDTETGSEAGPESDGPPQGDTALRDLIADRLYVAMHDYDIEVARWLADAVMPDIRAALDCFTDVNACAVALAAGVNPRDLQRARRGLHRRMYVPADRLIKLIEALDKCFPGMVAEVRAAEEGT